MNEMTAYCGLSCAKCPILVATVNNDNAERKRISEEWSTPEYPILPEDVNCDGCKSMKGRLPGFCSDCNIRICGSALEVENCAHCGSYPCTKLEKVFEKSPEARVRLDSIRQNEYFRYN